MAFVDRGRELAALEETYLSHVQALAGAAPIRPDALHLLFSKAGFDARVRGWAAGTRAHLLEPAELLAPL